MTLSKVSFSYILWNDYLDHCDMFAENFDYDTLKNDTFENDTFESVWVDSRWRLKSGFFLAIDQWCLLPSQPYNTF